MRSGGVAGLPDLGACAAYIIEAEDSSAVARSSGHWTEVTMAGDLHGDKGLKVGKLDVDENPQTAARYGIRSIPTVLFFKDGEVVDRVVGAMPKPVFEQKIQAHI